MLAEIDRLCRTGELAWMSDLELLASVSRRARESFRELLGCTPKEYLLCIRTGFGLQLVEQGSSVGDAAERAGFGDSSKFIHASHRVVGCTPLEFKRRNGDGAGPVPSKRTNGDRADSGPADEDFGVSGNARNPHQAR
ncbi:MAG: helix-turn-helix domain-containing protein [Gemmatimonadota bacterium]